MSTKPKPKIVPLYPTDVRCLDNCKEYRDATFVDVEHTLEMVRERLPHIENMIVVITDKRDGKIYHSASYMSSERYVYMLTRALRDETEDGEHGVVGLPEG